MNDLFESFTSLDNFESAYEKVKKGKGSKKEFILWDIDHDKRIVDVRQSLLDDT